MNVPWYISYGIKPVVCLCRCVTVELRTHDIVVGYLTMGSRMNMFTWQHCIVQLYVLCSDIVVVVIYIIMCLYCRYKKMTALQGGDTYEILWIAFKDRIWFNYQNRYGTIVVSTWQCWRFRQMKNIDWMDLTPIRLETGDLLTKAVQSFVFDSPSTINDEETFLQNF